MLAAFCKTDDGNSNCAKLLGTVSTAHENNTSNNTSLLSSNTNLISNILANGGMDYCSFYSGPTDAAIIAFGESAESCGSIAYASGAGESCGSIAYSPSASTTVSSSGSCFSGGGCSYSC